MRAGTVFSGIAAGLVWGIAAQAAGAAETPPPRVPVDSVKMVREAAPKRYVGSVESIRHVDIMPRITGDLRKVHFREGEMVRQGELLYELEDTTYKAAVDKLKAQKEALGAARLYAAAEYKRNSTLLESNAVAVAAYDKAQLEIDSARANLKELDAALADAENTLSYTRIHAPISGRIGKSAFTEGNLITPQGGKLTDIEMVAPIYVRFSLSERVFRRDFGGREGIRERAKVRIRLADNTLYPESARVTLVDNKVNATTNTVTVWATFANRDGRLMPGGFVTVLVSAAADRELPAVVPSALLLENDGCYLYVLDAENRAVRRKVETGGVAEGLQILRSGLDGSETILIDGTHKIRPGMTVTPVPAATPAAR